MTKPSFTKKDYIESWTRAPFQKNILKEASAILEQFEKGENSPDIEAYTIPLEFGTGGIRGVIGNGIGRMNEYTVGRAALGFSRYLVSKFKKPKIVIAFDSRRKSQLFAKVTAGIAAQNGIQVQIFPIETPTPILSYSIPHLKAHGGVVITASHNPPEYNGFKAYLNDGGQLVPPDDKKIIDLINSITDWNEVQILSEKDPIYKKFVSQVSTEVFESYMKKVFSSPIYNSKLDNKVRSKLKIVYSPLHGTGGAYMKKILNAAGYKDVFLVPEQQKPDGEFPTVKFPNPEEKEALALCEKHAKIRNADLFVATDPDADRMGVGIRNEKGEYVLLNGNQIGSILCAYMAEKVTANGKPKFDYHIFKTIVTTDLQFLIAKKNKLKIKDVLTGFKYIANEMNKIANDKKKKFLFGGEESYGYLPVDFVRDKDSLSSTLLLLEVLSEKKDLLTYLEEIYLKYGLYLESLKSIGLKGEAGKEKIQESLNLLRNSDLLGQKIGKREVIAVLDFKTRTGKGQFSKSVFSGLPPADVIQVYLSGNAKLTIRPSGTEPKVKIYSSFQSFESPKKREDLANLQSILHAEILESEKLFLKMAGLDG